METIDLSKIPLKEKIAQMVMVNGGKYNRYFIKLGVGGIYLGKLNSKEEYKKLIKYYKDNSKIKPLLSVDMEGSYNPFENFFSSKSFEEITNGKDSYKLGLSQGRIAKELGFDINFSPVVEIRNNVWPGRSFKGNFIEVKEKIINYINGLKECGIVATAKHYPGGSMVKDPHKLRYKTKIFKEDLELFDTAIEAGVKAIMVGHPIVSGAIDSKKKQSTISPEIIIPLRKKFNGLIITDDIHMMGLRWSYLLNFNRVYVDLVKAGNDIILEATPHFTKYKGIKKRIEHLEKAIKKGKISEERINESVKKILEMKGYIVHNSPKPI